MKRFIWSATFDNNDVADFYEGFLHMLNFYPVEGRVAKWHFEWVPEQVSEPLTDAEIEECIDALIEGGMTEAEARDFIDACTEEVVE